MLTPKNENLSRKKVLMLFLWFGKNCEMHHHETHSKDIISLELGLQVIPWYFELLCYFKNVFLW